jgi:hypothetical protein
MKDHEYDRDILPMLSGGLAAMVDKAEESIISYIKLKTN